MNPELTPLDIVGECTPMLTLQDLVNGGLGYLDEKGDYHSYKFDTLVIENLNPPDTKTGDLDLSLIKLKEGK